MKRFFAAALAVLGAQVALAQNFQYYVYPVQGITGISQSATGAPQTGPKYSGMINAKYADLFFTAPVQQALMQGFSEEVRKRFPQSVIGANQIASTRFGKYAYQPFNEVECKPNFTANYKDTFAIAIGISRLSAYINRYGNFVDALIPITYTLRFVKLNGADVVFARSETIYTRYTTTAAEFFAPGSQEMSPAVVERLRGAIQTDGLSMVARQVEAATKGFSPKQTDISVTGRDGAYIIFSHGSEVGFSSGENYISLDDKGEELSHFVVYATNGLAVAVASGMPEEKRLSNRVRVGDKLKFSFSKQGKDDAKPTVFAAQYTPGADGQLTDRQVINNALSAIVSDDIGFKAPFNVIKHDADFSRLKNQIRSEAFCESNIFTKIAGFADDTTLPRTQPDFYLRLDSYASPAFTSWGLGRVNSNTVFNNAVALSVMDRTGVVSQSFLGNAPYTLERSAGKGLSPDEASEVNLKNAALASMQSLISGFSNNARTVALKSVNAGVATLAQPLPVATLQQAQLVRPIRANGKQVLLPLDSNVAKIVVPTQDGDRIEFLGELKPTDMLLISGADAANRTLARCDASRQTRFLAPHLNKPSNADEAIAYHLMAKAKGYNLVETDATFVDSVERALKDGMFSGTSVARSAAPAACYVVLEQQQTPKNECAGDKCSGNAVVGSGVRIFVGTNRVAESTHGGRFEFKDIAPDALSDFIGFKAYELHMGALPVHRSKLH